MEPQDQQEHEGQAKGSSVGKVVRMVVVSIGALLILFTFIMAVYRKFWG